MSDLEAPTRDGSTRLEPMLTAIDANAVLSGLLAVLIVSTLWTTGVGLGMTVRPFEVTGVLRRRRLVAAIVVLDVVLVPAAMWVAVELFVADESIATGLLLVAFASAGPLGIKLADMAGADPAFAIGIVVMLELANIVVVPVWAALLGVATGGRVVLEMAVALAVFILLPIAVGQLIRRARPGVPEGWARRAARFSTLGLIGIVLLVVVRDLDVLVASLASGAVVAAISVITFALVAGWLVERTDRRTRLAVSLVTGTRANAVALAVATTAFPTDPSVAVGAVVAGLASVLMPTLVALWFASTGRAGTETAVS